MDLFDIFVYAAGANHKATTCYTCTLQNLKYMKDKTFSYEKVYTR